MSDAYDSPWKDMIERYFPDFMAFFFPQAWREIDWSRGYQSCDTELRKIVRDAELGKRLADKLMRVYRRDGIEQYVFTHIEVQGDPDPDFDERMYVYNYRIYDAKRCLVVSLAILGDDRPTWRPDGFGYELWGCRVSLTFPVVKLTDYADRWEELEASRNVFATVVMAHLKTKATRQDPDGRLEWKKHLVRRLYAGGHERQDAEDLLRFVDWLLWLPPELEARLDAEIERLEVETKMQYVTSWERRGIQKGKQEGLQLGKQEGLQEGILQGEVSVLKRQLKRRFSRIPKWAEERLERASREELESWADRVIEAQAIEEVFA